MTTYDPKYKETVFNYMKATLKRVPLDLKIADFEKLKKAAERAGESVNE